MYQQAAAKHEGQEKTEESQGDKDKVVDADYEEVKEEEKL